MDTISRENNSMLPVGGVIVGVIGLLLGIFASVQASKANKAIEAVQPKIEKIDGIETQAAGAAASAEKTAGLLAQTRREVQDNFTLVGNKFGELAGAITKLEEAQKKPVAAAGKKGGEAVVAGPGEYVVKSGDTGMKIARDHGVSLADLQTVNPGVNWNSLKVGVTKVKLPSTAKK